MLIFLYMFMNDLTSDVPIFNDLNEDKYYNYKGAMPRLALIILFIIFGTLSQRKHSAKKFDADQKLNVEVKQSSPTYDLENSNEVSNSESESSSKQEELQQVEIKQL